MTAGTRSGAGKAIEQACENRHIADSSGTAKSRKTDQLAIGLFTELDISCMVRISS